VPPSRISEAQLSRPEPISKHSMRLGANYCPGILHAVPAKDGLLMRIRVPGGLIEPKQLETIAHLARYHADGFVEITSRANLQLRAIRDQDLELMVNRIESVGLLPSREHDRVRNIVTSPLAGVDIDEIIDTRPLVRELDQRLMAETVFADLHPKFSFAIYGGGKRIRQETDDFALNAVSLSDDLHFLLSIGGMASGFAVVYEHAVDCLLEIAKACLDLGKQHGLPVRGRLVSAIPGAMQQIVEVTSHWLTPCSQTADSISFAEIAPGIYPAIQPDRVNIIPSVPLGRLTVEQGEYLAKTAADVEADLRLAPWRGIVLGSIPMAGADEIVARLQSLGLFCDGEDGFRGIAACSGNTGCDASLADVRGDAASLAQLLAGLPKPSGWTVNLSGCEKQCARRHGATAEMIAEASGYTLRIKGQPVASGCSSGFAINAVAALHTEMLSKVASR
jgi:precorrin-3B synthase